ncbi:MAG: NHL repeat-containing protein [Salinibacter sp.]|uniref:NHL repeat-containing protein n=1 Tax=Salinibacter sp. TaxID=2065818 RepID=UPI0035D5189E
MILRSATFLVIGLTAAWGLALHPAPAQDTTEEGKGPTLAQFEDARALAVDPRGQLYVADAARDVVALLRPNGTRRAVIGGGSTQAGSFNEPSDVDPTNGQVLLVADTYNGRVQRFSGEGRYLETLSIGPDDQTDSESWVFSDRQSGFAVQGAGRPVAVVSSSDGAIFVIDARGGVLRKWTEFGRLQRIAGGNRRGASQLKDPVALALGSERRLYVADAGQGRVLVYDRYGTFIRRLRTPPLPKVRALTMHQGRLWIVCADRLVIWTRAQRQVTERSIDLEKPLVDAAPQPSALYLLTRTRLTRRSR